jgi:hypothetical protein
MANVLKRIAALRRNWKRVLLYGGDGAIGSASGVESGRFEFEPQSSPQNKNQVMKLINPLFWSGLISGIRAEYFYSVVAIMIT